MDKYKITKILRKKYKTLMQEYGGKVSEYLDSISTTDDAFALEAVTRYLINLEYKKNKKKENGI